MDGVRTSAPVAGRQSRTFPRPGLAARSAQRRREARTRAERRVSRPVPPALRAHDPLARRGRTWRGSLGRLAAYAAVAVGLHLGVVLGFGGLGQVVADDERGPRTERVVVRVVEPLRPALELPAPQVVDEPSPVAVAEPEPRVEPTPAAEPARTPRPRPSRARVEELPADPVNRDAPTPAAEAPAAPPRRVVGLSLESTVTGSGGPAFAVGNTRMGETADRAVDPRGVQRLTPSPKGTVAGARPAPNQAATVLPVAEQQFVKPRRLAEPQLDYPGVLKAQGIEGNVAVLIRVSTDGAVLSVKVIKSSGYAEFDRAARVAALKERFAPALRNGEPVEYTLKYTYRFRLTSA